MDVQIDGVKVDYREMDSILLGFILLYVIERLKALWASFIIG